MRRRKAACITPQALRRPANSSFEGPAFPGVFKRTELVEQIIPAVENAAVRDDESRQVAYRRTGASPSVKVNYCGLNCLEQRFSVI